MKLFIFIKIILGFIALLFGAVGLFFPIWPTTPFILLSLACFASTPKIQRKILTIPFVKEFYGSYTEGHGLRRKTVIISLTFLWGMMLLSILVTQRLWVGVLLTAIGVIVTIHILWISRKRTVRKLS